jgi:hypothetical protein
VTEKNDNGEADNSWLGQVGLWTSIIGLALPLLGVNLVHIAPKVLGLEGFLTNAVWITLGLNCQLVALFFGIAGRGTAAGKAGLIISSVSLLAALVFVLFIFTNPRARM